MPTLNSTAGTSLTSTPPKYSSAPYGSSATAPWWICRVEESIWRTERVSRPGGLGQTAFATSARLPRMTVPTQGTYPKLGISMSSARTTSLPKDPVTASVNMVRAVRQGITLACKMSPLEAARSLSPPLAHAPTPLRPYAPRAWLIPPPPRPLLCRYSTYLTSVFPPADGWRSCTGCETRTCDDHLAPMPSAEVTSSNLGTLQWRIQGNRRSSPWELDHHRRPSGVPRCPPAMSILWWSFGSSGGA